MLVSFTQFSDGKQTRERDGRTCLSNWPFTFLPHSGLEIFLPLEKEEEQRKHIYLAQLDIHRHIHKYYLYGFLVSYSVVQKHCILSTCNGGYSYHIANIPLMGFRHLKTSQKR